MLARMDMLSIRVTIDKPVCIEFVDNIKLPQPDRAGEAAVDFAPCERINV
jgi:hypothetical protein